MAQFARITLPTQFTLKAEFHLSIPFVWGEWNGKTCRFLFDSGGQDLTLNSKYLDPASVVEGQGAQGATGFTPNVHAPIESIRFGDWSMENLEVFAIDATHLEEEFKVEIHGILGFRHLIHYDWMLDYRTGEITFWDRVRKENLDILHRERVQYRHHLPALMLEIGGHSLRFLVDTGCEEVLIDQQWREKLGDCIEGMATDSMASASQIRLAVEKGTIRQFRLGDLEFGPNKVTFSDLSHMQSLGAFDGIIGYPLLSKYRVVQSWSVSAFYFLRD